VKADPRKESYRRGRFNVEKGSFWGGGRLWDEDRLEQPATCINGGRHKRHREIKRMGKISEFSNSCEIAFDLGGHPDGRASTGGKKEGDRENERMLRKRGRKRPGEGLKIYF